MENQLSTQRQPPRVGTPGPECRRGVADPRRFRFIAKSRSLDTLGSLARWVPDVVRRTCAALVRFSPS
jgi:hypothetical protein